MASEQSWVVLVAVFALTLLPNFLKAEVCQFHLSGDNKLFEKVPENLVVGSEIARVRVFPRQFFAIESTDNQEDIEYVKYSEVDDHTMALLVARSLEDLVDQPQPKSVLKFKLACRGNNSSEAVYLPVNIYIQDINDHTPQFQNAPYFVEVDELTPVGLTIFRGIQAKDGDKPNTANSEVSFSIIGGNTGDTFLLSDPMEGNVVVAKPLDYDHGPREYKLEIQVQDHGAPVSHSSITTLTVKVRDSDDQNPAFNSDVYTVKVNEKFQLTGQPIREKLQTEPSIHAEDLDKAINASLRYTIVAGNEGDFFAMDSKDGSLYLLKEIDREQLIENMFTLQIQAAQEDNPIRLAKARVEVHVIDLNDNLPIFEADLYNISIMENLPKGFSVAQVRAIDEDLGDNSLFQFQLKDDSGAFQIDDTTGWITVKNQSRLDRERQSVFSFKVLAVEKAPSVFGNLEPSSTAVEVHLIDTNDNSPQFVPSSVYRFNITEVAVPGTIVGTLKAIDADQDENGRVFYYQKQELSLSPLPFDVHRENGSIYVVESPSKSSTKAETYTMFVIAADKPNDPTERRTSLAVVYIGTDDVNNNPPTFLGMPLKTFVGENLPPGTVVTTLMAKDPDSMSRLEFHLDNQNGSLPFTLDPKTGTVSTTASLDFETKPLYTFPVEVTDGDFIVSAPLAVHVIDVNDHVPLFSQPVYNFSVVEEEEPGLIIGMVKAFDSEQGKNGEIHYTLQDPSEQKAFGITENGTLFTLRPIDREKEPHFTLIVLASDAGVPPLTAEARIYVHVEDINDNPPLFPVHQLVRSVPEEMPPPISIVTVSAKDADLAENAKILYYITWGNADGFFHINETSGELIAQETLDYEYSPRHVLNITAVDREDYEGGPIRNIDLAPSTVQIIINVENRHDTPPVFERDNYIFAISEDHRPFEAAAIVNAYNSSTGFEQKIVYWISDNAPNSKLRLDSETGEIVLTEPIDRDPPNNEVAFKLQVSARDLKSISPSNSSTSVTILVTDVNDNSPKFELDYYQTQIPEDLPIGSQIPIILNASDKDEGLNGQIGQYRFNSSHSKFIMNNQTSIITLVEPLDYEEENRFTFEVLAIDNGDPPRTGSVTLIINILNINEHPPQFLNSSYTFYGGENLGSGTQVGQVTARDADGNSIVYSLVRGDIDYFDIDETSGKVYTKAGTGTRSLYHLVAMAIDDGQPKALSSTVDVTIHVKEANNHPPVFSQPVYEATVPEKDTSGDVIVQLSANDDDPLNNNITYSITEGNEERIFVVDKLNGEIRVNPEKIQDLDYDVKTSYTLVVEAQDSHEKPRVGVAMVKIIVEDTNDHPPKFTKGQYDAAIKENIQETLCFVQVQADSGDSVDQVHYTLVGNPHYFAVDGASGRVCAIKPLDREQQEQYVLTVKATDNKFNSFATVNVEVIDENDNAPKFELDKYEVTVPRDARPGEKVAYVRAEDPDTAYNGQVTYWTTNNYGLFELDYKTGVVTLLQTFPATESDNIYVLDLFAQDHGMDPKTGRARLVVKVSAKGGHKPLFDKFVYQTAIPEQETNVSIVTVHATDPDDGDEDRVRYRVARHVPDSDLFDVDPDTGEVSLLEPLDFATSRFHQVEIQAYDEGEELTSSSTIIKVKVQNTNNFAPEFTLFPTMLRIPVSTAIGQPVYRVRATDKDDIYGNQKVSYELNNGHSMFAINEDTGDITIERRGLPLVKNLSIIAKDGGIPPMEREAILQLEVYDEKAPRMQPFPIFSSNQYVREFNDVINAGTPIVQVQAVTYNGDPVGFGLPDGPHSSAFGVDMETGIVYTKRSIGRGEYHMPVIAFNKLLPAAASEVVVSVLSKAFSTDCAQFTFPEYRASVSESTSAGRLVLSDIQVEDPEIHQQLLYRIERDSSSGAFAMEVKSDNTAQLVLRNQVDRETMPTESNGIYELKVSVTNDNCTSNATIKIFVEDVNDNDPQFLKGEYAASVKENSPAGSNVIVLSAHDVDEVDAGFLRFNILQGNEGSHFSLDEKSGAISVLNAIDREQTESFELLVQVKDSGNHSGSTRVRIEVVDENDETPRFENDTYIFITKEGPSSLKANLVLEALDADTGPNSQLEYYIVKGNDDGEFNIATMYNKGVLTVAQELDRDAYETDGAAVRFVIIGVRDKGTPSLSSTTMVTVVIEDINDFPPEFEHETYHELISEGVPVGHNITQIHAVDRDSAENTNIVYGMKSSVSGEELPFSMDPATGLITVNKLLDFSEKNEYNITLLVTDGTHTTMGTLLIYVTEALDRQPRMDQAQYDFRVEENKAGEQVGKIQMGQARDSLRRPIDFKIINKEAMDYFVISPDGTIYTKVPLDREKREIYTFAVVQEDKKLPGRKDVCEVRVLVDDVNDEAPTFSRDYEGIIRENSVPGSTVTIQPGISAVDKDSGMNSVFHYSLAGSGSDLFEIDPIQGVVSLSSAPNATLDRESVAQYNLQVVATDLHNLSSSTDLKIVVEDENDNSPVFLHGDQAIEIPETTTAGMRIAQVVARDDDAPGPNSAVTYTIVGGAEDKFTVDKNTGEIFLSSALIPETFYMLNLSAKDGGGRSTHTLVQVKVADVNNHEPKFLHSEYRFEVPEGRYAVHPQVLGVLRAHDEDHGPNAAIDYRLASTPDDGWPFAIDVSTGHLNITRDLDRETKSSYQFVVMAMDQGTPPLSSTVSVTVTVTDVNDEYPHFIGDPYFASVPENQNPGHFVAQVRAYDLDSNATGNGQIFYKLGNEYRNEFFIDTKEGTIWTLRSLDYERQTSYNITVIAYDQGQPSLSATAMLFLNVTDKNDVTPNFKKSVFMVEVAENASPGTIVYKLNAGSSNFKYSVIDDDVEDTFSVDGHSGEITLLRHLDTERKNRYRLLVKASDDNSPPNNDTAEIVLLVATGPALRAFPRRRYAVDVRENLPAPIVVLDLNSTEESLARKIEYEIVGNDYAGLFAVDRSNGKVSIMKSLDREIKSEYQLKVRASGSSQLSVTKHGNANDLAADETMIIINVEDENDNTPDFGTKGRPFVAAVPVEATFGYEIMTFKAQDADAGLNSVVRYEMVHRSEEESGRFQIDSKTGVLRVLSPLLLDAGKVFGFDVRAMDRDGADDGNSAYVNTLIYVVPENKLAVLVVGEKPVIVEENIPEITQELSNATGYEIKMSKLAPHKEEDEIDKGSTDLYLYAVDPTTNTIVDTDRLINMLNDKQEILERNLAPYKVGHVEGITFRYKSAQLSITEVALLAFGCIVFVAVSLAIFMACLKRRRKKSTPTQSKQQLSSLWADQHKPYGVRTGLMDRPSRSSYGEGSVDTGRHPSNIDYNDVHTPRDSYKDSLSSTSTLDLQKARRNRQRAPSGLSEGPPPPGDSPKPPRRILHDDDVDKSKIAGEWPEDVEMERTVSSDYPPTPPSPKGNYYGTENQNKDWWERSSRGYGYQ